VFGLYFLVAHHAFSDFFTLMHIYLLMVMLCVQ
jgi:hypothetical protein